MLANHYSLSLLLDIIITESLSLKFYSLSCLTVDVVAVVVGEEDPVAEAEEAGIGEDFEAGVVAGVLAQRKFSRIRILCITCDADNSRPTSGTAPVVNQRVRNAEDAFEKELAGDSLGLQKLTIDAHMPIRPGFGTKGRKVLLYANYFEMVPKPDVVLYRYSIQILPDVAGKKKEQVVRIILDLPELDEFRNDIVTDFRTTIISRRRLSQEFIESRIQYRAEGEDTPLPNAQTYRIKVETSGVLTVSQLTNYLSPTNLTERFDDKPEII